MITGKDSTRKLVLHSLMAAMIALMTAAVKAPVPATGGYVHPGDGVIFLAAALMGPQAWIPAALGSALADILGGYAVYAIPTAAIKGLMGFIAGQLLRGKGRMARNGLVLALCEMVMIAGYFALEWAMYGGAAAWSAVIPNLIQGTAGVLIGCALISATNRLER